MYLTVKNLLKTFKTDNAFKQKQLQQQQQQK